MKKKKRKWSNVRGDFKKKRSHICTNCACPLNLLNKTKSHPIIREDFSVNLKSVERHFLEFSVDSKFSNIISGEYATHRNIISCGAPVFYKPIGGECHGFTHIAVFVRPKQGFIHSLDKFNDLGQSKHLLGQTNYTVSSISWNQHKLFWQLALTSGKGLVNLPKDILLMGPPAKSKMVYAHATPPTGIWHLPKNRNEWPANMPLSEFENSEEVIDCSISSMEKDVVASIDMITKIRNELARQHSSAVGNTAPWL